MTTTTLAKATTITLPKKIEKLVESKPELRSYVETLTAPLIERAAAKEAITEWVTNEGKRIKGGTSPDKAVARCLDALVLGYEPTTPPTTWYCGSLAPVRDSLLFTLFTAPLRLLFQFHWNPGREQETWRSQAYRGGTVMLFKPAMPADCYAAYRKAENFFDEAQVRIYSPDASHFTNHKVKPIDPVIIGRIDMGNDTYEYFEVARWNIKEDIAMALDKIQR